MGMAAIRQSSLLLVFLIISQPMGVANTVIAVAGPTVIAPVSRRGHRGPGHTCLPPVTLVISQKMNRTVATKKAMPPKYITLSSALDAR